MNLGKRDIPETDWLHSTGLISDSRSFRSLDGRLILRGIDWEHQKQRVWMRDKGKCQLCRRPCEDGVADPDHIIKRSKGGDDSLSNLRTTHRECHNERHPEKRLRFGEQRASD